uniref:Uncharacterized protein n=1 Tax=Phlebotomus papatasi TaxID=29031 RepID=A0A1B0D958_PHLPP
CRFGVNLCPGRGRQTLCQQFNNEILSEQLQKVKSAQSVEDFRKLLERISKETTKRPPKNVQGDLGNHLDILVPQQRKPVRGQRERKVKLQRKSVEEEGKVIEDWIGKLAVNCHEEGFLAHLRFLDECTARLSKKDLYPYREPSPTSVKSDSGRRSYRISVKIDGSRWTKTDHHDANLIESFTRLDISRGNATLPQIVLNDDFTNTVDTAEHLTSSRHTTDTSPDVAESLKSLKVPSLLKIAVEARSTLSRKFSR